MLVLPEFRVPNFQTVTIKLLNRARVFLKRAGTVIFLVAILIWMRAYFPRMDTDEFISTWPSAPASDITMEHTAAATKMEQSWLGRIGRTIEPVFKPLGWETNSWRWPALAWFYMTGLGYAGALIIYQLGSLI